MENGNDSSVLNLLSSILNLLSPTFVPVRGRLITSRIDFITNFFSRTRSVCIVTCRMRAAAGVSI